MLTPLLSSNSSQLWHFVYLISSTITKKFQKGDCQTGSSLGLFTIAAEVLAGESVATDFVKLHSNDVDLTEESI